MAYAGSGTPPGSITYILQSDNAATIQAKINSVQSGNSLVFERGTYDFGGATIAGKSGITVWADGPVAINNAPGAGSGGAFDFSGQTDWTIGGNSPGNGFIFNGSLVNATNASGNWTIGNCIFNNQQSNGFDGSAIRMNGASFGTIVEDSGEAARLFRDDGARDSEMMPPGSAATLADAFVALGSCRRQSSNLF